MITARFLCKLLFVYDLPSMCRIVSLNQAFKKRSSRSPVGSFVQSPPHIDWHPASNSPMGQRLMSSTTPFEIEFRSNFLFDLAECTGFCHHLRLSEIVSAFGLCSWSLSGLIEASSWRYSLVSSGIRCPGLRDLSGILLRPYRCSRLRQSASATLSSKILKSSIYGPFLRMITLRGTFATIWFLKCLVSKFGLITL